MNFLFFFKEFIKNYLILDTTQKYVKNDLNIKRNKENSEKLMNK